jgi:hypothetical protein
MRLPSLRASRARGSSRIRLPVIQGARGTSPSRVCRSASSTRMIRHRPGTVAGHIDDRAFGVRHVQALRVAASCIACSSHVFRVGAFPRVELAALEVQDDPAAMTSPLSCRSPAGGRKALSVSHDCSPKFAIDGCRRRPGRTPNVHIRGRALVVPLDGGVDLRALSRALRACSPDVRADAAAGSIFGLAWE